MQPPTSGDALPGNTPTLDKNANAEELNGRFFSKRKPTPPSEHLTYVSYFCHITVCTFQIELEGWKNHGAQDQLPTRSHSRHVLGQEPEYAYLLVELKHLIFRALLLPPDLPSWWVRQFIPVENSPVQVEAARVIRLLTIPAQDAAEGWGLNTPLPTSAQSSSTMDRVQSAGKALTNVTQAQMPRGTRLGLSAFVLFI